MNAIGNATTSRTLNKNRFGVVGAPRGGRVAIMELLEARQMLSGEGTGSVVFVGSDVADREGVAAIFADAEVVFLESERGGRGAIGQISEILAARHGLESVQFFTHGAAGELRLGDSSLDAAGLGALARDVAGWGKALAPDGDILLWGCDVGAGAAGLKFVREFARLTGADVAASTDVTGAAALGGDWVLERAVGEVSQRISALGFDGYEGTLGNTPPTIMGTITGHIINDTDITALFGLVQIEDADLNTLDITISLDDPAKGVFTPASLTASGFTDAGGGVYTFTGTPSEATFAIIQLGFDPTDNRVAVGQTETTTFTITADDGFAPPVVDSATTVISTSVNDSPVIGGAVAGQSVNDNATITPFAAVTLTDADNPAQVVNVTITIDDPDKGMFTTASLIASGFFDNLGGVYFMTATTAAAQAGIRLLVFNPADNRGLPGSTETTTFTIEVEDGFGPNTTDDTTTVVSTSVNDAPTVNGTVADQDVNDNATITPFGAVTIGDADPGQMLAVQVTLDDAAKGVFTPASLLASGFVDAGGGVYDFAGTAAEATAAIRQLEFDPTDDRVVPGLTETTTFTIVADDGHAPVSDSATTVASAAVNDVPMITGTVAGQAIDDTDTVLLFAGVTIADADSQQALVVGVAIDDAAKGEFTTESLLASGFMGNGSGMYQFMGTAAEATAAIRLLNFAPADERGVLGSMETSTFTISVADSLATPVMDNTTTVVSTATGNVAPTLTVINTLPGATARLTYTIAYADLLAASDAADANAGDVLSFRVEVVESGTLLKNGVAVIPGVTTLGVGETLEWRSAPGATGATPAFIVVATDGSAVSDPVGVSVEVAAIAPNTAAEGGNVSIAVDPAGLTTVATRNDAGQLIVLQQDGPEGTWVLVDLSGVSGIDVILGDPQVFVDPTFANNSGHGTYVAVTTAAGVVLVWNEAGTWTGRNLTEELAAPAITGDLVAFTSIDRRQVLAGFTSDGDMVIYFQTVSAPSPVEATWQATNLYEYLRGIGESTPEFVSSLTPYVTSWNGLNIAGLDASGNIWTIWTGGGIEMWHSSNISAITGAPALVGNVAAYTTEWGGINLTGIDTNGDLTVSWWVPTFGGNWVNSNMTALFGGPDLRGESITAYVTPWNSLNIAGVDENGDVVQYWWVPPPEPDMWNIDNLTVNQSVSIPRFAGRLTGTASQDSRLNLVGQSEDGHILRVWWSPSTGWQFEDLTALV